MKTAAAGGSVSVCESLIDEVHVWPQNDGILTFVQTNVRIHDVVSPHLVEVCRVVGRDCCLLTVTVIMQHVMGLMLGGGCGSSWRKRADRSSRETEIRDKVHVCQCVW